MIATLQFLSRPEQHAAVRRQSATHSLSNRGAWSRTNLLPP